MKLGIVARADDTGLGNQTREAVYQLEPHRVLLVDISSLNGNAQHPEWYEGFNVVHSAGFPNRGHIAEFLEGLDVIFVAESPYNYELYNMARERGVKIAVQYNYEFFDWFVYGWYPKPDMLIAPSKWHYDVIDAYAESEGIKHLYLHYPVNRKDIPRRQITEAKKFLHIAGKPAVHDRNGTESFLAVAKQLKDTGATFTVATQDLDLQDRIKRLFPSVVVRPPVPDYQDNYAEDDVLVMPRRYGGNCLPVNEALSAGMPVLMTDISPNNQLLPPDWLVPAFKIGSFTPRQPVGIYGADEVQLMVKIIWFINQANMKRQSDIANAIADSISWETMKPMYLTALEDLCHK